MGLINFIFFFDLQKHYKTHSSIGDDSGGIFCHLCGYKLKNMDKIKEHFKRHKEFGPNQCVICNEIGLDKFNLRHHVKVKVIIQCLLKILFLFFTFFFISLLFAQHCALEDNNLLCDTCGKTFSHSRAWRNHQKTHTDDRPYQCAHCDKAFKEKFSLNKHIQTHVSIFL